MLEDKNKKPRVSVCVVTYNHEKYIRQCLQSIVDQKTDYDFEVIVGEDCSTDGTRAIVQEFAAKYPGMVKPIFYKKNVGGSENYIRVHEKALGEYIAHMDGDDYSLPGKIQMQAEYLDNNSQCNIVWHRMYIMNDSSGLVVEDLIDMSEFPIGGFSRSDILKFITIGMHSSKMYRSSVRDFELPEFPVLDYFVNVEQVGTGFANFVGGKPLGVYRAGIGIASSGNITKVLLKKTFLYFERKYPEHKSAISTAAFVLFCAALKNRKWSNCLLFGKVLLKTFRLSSIIDIWCNRNILSMLRIPATVRKG